jgi:hypothetical protein
MLRFCVRWLVEAFVDLPVTYKPTSERLHMSIWRNERRGLAAWRDHVTYKLKD